MAIVAFPQTPLVQVVPAVQPFWSSHIWPSLAGTPFAHAPFAQASFIVHGFLSSQAVPSSSDIYSHVFRSSLQVPFEQPSFDGHAFGWPTQLPFLQTASVVQNLPSSHAWPSFCGLLWHPSLESQKPTVHSVSRFVQLTAKPAMHTPPLHVSAWVHASPSSHAAPSFPFVLTHDFFFSSHLLT
jgi:hypothetical protein